MFNKLINFITGKFMLANLSHTNSSFSTDIKDESAYVEQDIVTEWISLEEAKKLKIRIASEGIDLEDMFKDVKIFSAGDKFNTKSNDFVQEQVDNYEAPVLKAEELKKKISTGEKLAESENSFKRSKEEK